MSAMQRTKIVCTMGPSTEDDDILREMILSGMSVARFNFSHGTHEYHRKNIERVRRVSAELGIPVALLMDTKGPEIRTRKNEDRRPILLETGTNVIVTAEDVRTTAERIALDYGALSREVESGSKIFIDDGLIGLKVIDVEGDDIHCEVTNGGLLGEQKGVNVPNVVMELPSVTERDLEDIRFACEMNADALALSFVRDAQAVRDIREFCKKHGSRHMLIFSKIESSLALGNFDEILQESHGIMVARGDLGVEIPPAEVPAMQKKIIRKCNAAYKPVITATQMLDSMAHNPRPTRAEVTDVATAINDGTDCVMLSAETAVGTFPVETVRMMAEVCRQTEQNLPERHTYYDRGGLRNVSGAVGFSAVETARHVGAVALLCPTNYGRTARIMSTFRPHLPIIATTPVEGTVRRTCFYWGVQGVLTEEKSGLAQTCYGCLDTARDEGFIDSEDIVVITAGDPLTSPLTGVIESAVSTNVCMVAQALL